MKVPISQDQNETCGGSAREGCLSPFVYRCLTSNTFSQDEATGMSRLMAAAARRRRGQHPGAAGAAGGRNPGRYLKMQLLRPPVNV